MTFESMMRSSVAAMLALFASTARADAIPDVPEDCPVGSVGVASHCGAVCRALVCANDGECPDGTACLPSKACILVDDCVRPMENIHVGPCSPESTCAGEGVVCKSLKLCVPGESTSSDDGGTTTTGTTGTATSGTATTDTSTSGTATSDTVTSGTATSGTAATDTATGGTATGGTATSGTATSGMPTTDTSATSDATPTTGQPGSTGISTGEPPPGSGSSSTGGAPATDPKGGCAGCVVGGRANGALGLLVLLALIPRRRAATR